jgi:hypothetical protein
LYLFLDTKTTAVPRTQGAPPAAVRQWPRLVEIAWAAYGEAGKWLAAGEHLVYPADFAVPAATTRIHCISTAKAAVVLVLLLITYYPPPVLFLSNLVMGK